ncbi:hypothetical protein [Nocardia acidivorans]|uniref:hypothetical protein n=1 Tax=Nocardia acidivorans TaxID=404580 RepID=UPI000AAAE0A4|nr:hypothetical protein [Nocardia acidivorans]
MRTPGSAQRAAPISDSCDVVPERFNTELAQSILSVHRSCPTDQCARRKAAVFFLYDQARHRVPSGTRRR